MAPTIPLWLIMSAEGAMTPLPWPGVTVASQISPNSQCGSKASTRGGMGVYLQHLSPWIYRSKEGSAVLTNILGMQHQNKISKIEAKPTSHSPWKLSCQLRFSVSAVTHSSSYDIRHN